ncbi:MAG: DsrE/DsrF/DrsH-like family protein [Gammaproteobacteria bacterium]
MVPLDSLDTRSDPLVALEARLAALEAARTDAPDPNSLNLLVFSGELDKLMAAFTVASGAAACGMRVSMFFTFWGAAALKKAGGSAEAKTLVERLFGWMLPGGIERRPLSRLNFLGMGRFLMNREMSRKNVASLPALIEMARDGGVEILLCETTLSLMGISPEEIIDYPGIRYCGVAHFVELASRSNTTLFI